MMRPAQARRLLHIQRVLIKHGLDEFLAHSRATRVAGRVLGLGVSRSSDDDAPRGVRIRLALEELGPIFVKFGQSLSTRPDLLPRDIADELAKLQDAVPPFPGEQARELAETAYGQPLETLFARFDDEPLAAASIAQVHAAALQDGREVVVKILRPGVHEQIGRDLAVLYALARIAQRYWPEAQRLRPLEVVAEYDKVVNDELDLMREAANAAQLRRNFTDSALLYVPEVHWEFCRAECARHRAYPRYPGRRCGGSEGQRRRHGAGSPPPGSRSFLPRCSGTIFFMPTCIRATSLSMQRTRPIRAIWRWISVSSAA